jgi:hypothetical protein
VASRSVVIWDWCRWKIRAGSSADREPLLGEMRLIASLKELHAQPTSNLEMKTGFSSRMTNPPPNRNLAARWASHLAAGGSYWQ